LNHVPLLAHFLSQLFNNLCKILLEYLLLSQKVCIAIVILKLEDFLNLSRPLIYFTFSDLLGDPDILFFASFVLFPLFVELFLLLLQFFPLHSQVLYIHFIYVNGVASL
jgi:hypothetical protein